MRIKHDQDGPSMTSKILILSFASRVLIYSPVLWASCPPIRPYRTILETNQEIHWIYETSNDSILIGNDDPDLPLFRDFKETITSYFPPDPYLILRHDREVFARNMPHIAILFDLIIDHKVGSIRKASCLEKKYSYPAI